MASLAVILNEPATDVVRCYDGPSKLYGLHLLGQTHTWHFFTLNDLLNMASFTVRLLETQFDNSNDLLVALMQPQYHAVIMPDTSVSRTLLEFWLPRRVADAYQVATQHVPLSAAHIAALVHWFTRCELDAKAFSRWAGKLDFETLVLATKRYCFEQSLASQPLTASGLLHTLHVAVAQR